MCCHDISMVMSFSSESILYEYIFRRWTFTIYIFSKFDFFLQFLCFVTVFSKFDFFLQFLCFVTVLAREVF